MPTRDDAFRLSDEALERLKPEGAAPATDESEAEPEKPETPAKPDEKPAPAPAPAEPEPDEDEGDDEDDEPAEGDAAPDAEALEKIAAEVEALLKEEAPTTAKEAKSQAEQMAEMRADLEELVEDGTPAERALARTTLALLERLSDERSLDERVEKLMERREKVQKDARRIERQIEQTVEAMGLTDKQEKQVSAYLLENPERARVLTWSEAAHRLFPGARAAAPNGAGPGPAKQTGKDDVAEIVTEAANGGAPAAPRKLPKMTRDTTAAEIVRPALRRHGIR